MIETEQTVTIAAGIDRVWDFARDIRGWASLMPGMQACDVVDDDNSHWVLKVGVGGLVRTVKVDVRVDAWDGPGSVLFTYKLQGDPVQGGGAYAARATGPEETEVALQVRVQGSGPMAPMWEAMGRPLLPKLARGFANQFKDKIEADTVSTAPTGADAGSPEPGGIMAGLRSFRSRLPGGRRAQAGADEAEERG